MIRLFRYTLLVSTLLLISYLSLNYSSEKAPLKITVSNNPHSFVVLELFTSQSCSSCPAANAHFENLLQEIRKKNLPVYPLAFHVDYWNHLGWVDSFSNEKYTERQYRYAHAFSRLNVYTPQIVINGTEEFVGSDIEKCQSKIESELNTRKLNLVSLIATYSYSEDLVHIKYNVDSSFKGIINIALVQKEADISITAGENEGRDITYFNIVRQFSQKNCLNKPHGKITFIKPVDVSKENLKVVAYLQNKINMQIVNAIEATLL